MVKGLIGRHLNDHSPVLNMAGRVAQATERNTWMITAPDRWMTSLAHGFFLQTYAYTVSVYVYVRLSLRMGFVLWINVYVCLCECACDMAGRHAHKPCGVPYSEPPQSREDLDQTDYSTATMTASNGRNKTPFNEDANLRNITLCSEI